MTLACPPRANFLPSFSLHCPYNVLRGVSKLAAANTSDGISVDVQAAEANTLTKANTPTTGNSLGLDIQADDVTYIATVQMGTPPRDFKLLMDSGSADLWVGAEGCKSLAGGDCVSFTSDFFFPFINLLILTVP
jgi:Eukaryotic aspartyl protease